MLAFIITLVAIILALSSPRWATAITIAIVVFNLVNIILAARNIKNDPIEFIKCLILNGGIIVFFVILAV